MSGPALTRSKMRSHYMEWALVRHFDYRANLIVPNVYWGLGFHYELDLCIITPSNYIWEVEIKISRNDLKRDQSKKRCHDSNRIKRLYFAMPWYMDTDEDKALVPERAGIVVVDQWLQCKVVREPIDNRGAGEVKESDKIKLLRLAALRVWDHIRNPNIGESMNFGDAVTELKKGQRVRRKGWNGVGMWLQLQVPDANSKMTLPYIYIEYPVGHKAYPEGSRVPWLASQTDALSDDWEVVTDENVV